MLIEKRKTKITKTTRTVRKSDYTPPPRFSASNEYGLFKENKTSHNTTQISNINHLLHTVADKSVNSEQIYWKETEDRI